MAIIMAVLFLAGFAVLYLWIGAFIGVVGWDVWTEKKKGLLSFLLFPISYIDGSLHSEQSKVPPGLDPGSATENRKAPNEDERVNYIKMLALIWPLKIILNSITCLYAATAIAVNSVISHMTRNAEQSLFKRRIRVASPPLSRRIRFEKLLEERQRIDTELNQLESELSEEEGAKVYRLPGRRSK